MDNIVKIAVEEKITELTAHLKIIEKASAELEKKMATQKAEYEKRMDEIAQLKKFLDTNSETDAEKGWGLTAEGKPRKKPGRKKKEETEEMMIPLEARSQKSVNDHNRYLRRKAEMKEANAPRAEVPESVEEINAKARAAGLSYGKYLAREMIERQSSEMEARRRERHLREAENERERVLEQDQSDGLSDPSEEKAN